MTTLTPKHNPIFQHVPILCIPRVYANISEARIRKIFEELNLGTIDHIDVVNKNGKDGEKFNRVFIHFKAWNNSENSIIARERLLNGKEIKIIYDEPWFWKISAYREQNRHTNNSNYTNQTNQTNKPYNKKPHTPLQLPQLKQEPDDDDFIIVHKSPRRNSNRYDNSHRHYEPRPPRNYITPITEPPTLFVPRSPSNSPPRYPSPTPDPDELRSDGDTF
jgi:hypothetical protein